MTTPTLLRNVERDKQIPGKERARDPFSAPRMARESEGLASRRNPHRARATRLYRSEAP